MKKPKSVVPVECSTPARKAKSDPHGLLSDVQELLLHSDPAYQFRYNKSGVCAVEDAWNDPENIPTPLELIEAFRMAIASGVYPDPKTMVYVANCFAMYLDRTGMPDKKGKVRLDACFGVQGKQKAGSPVEQREDRRVVDLYLYRMAVYRGENPEATIREAATSCYEGNENAPDKETYIDTMAKYYERQWSPIEKQMVGERLKFVGSSDGK